MPWSKDRPHGSKTAARYRDPAYLATVRQLRAELHRAGTGVCAEVVCTKTSRTITPSMELHACHDRVTGKVLGLGHADCNRSEAGRYARSLRGESAPRSFTRGDW